MGSEGPIVSTPFGKQDNSELDSVGDLVNIPHQAQAFFLEILCLQCKLWILRHVIKEFEPSVQHA